MSDTDFNYILKGKDLNDKSFLYIYVHISLNNQFKIFLFSPKWKIVLMPSVGLD